MWGYFCTGFIDFMWKGKSLLNKPIVFSLSEYEINGKIKWKFFQYLIIFYEYILKRWEWIKSIVIGITNI